MKIIFMGTPDFAVPALRALIESPLHDVVACYTQPPRPVGRGYQLQVPPVAQLAIEHDIPVFHPTSFKSQQAIAEFEQFNADIAVVAAYGLLLPEPILTACPFGCINIHSSLLPRWRGASPIQHTILHGDKEGGVSIMQLCKEMDAGDVWLQQAVKITQDMTAAILHDQLSLLAVPLLQQALELIQTGKARPRAQEEAQVTYAHKISKQDGVIDWQEEAAAILRRIRAFTPWPGCTTTILGEIIKIHRAQVVQVPQHKAPKQCGEVIAEPLVIQCGKDALEILEMQRPGKNRADSASVLRGFAVPIGTKCGE